MDKSRQAKLAAKTPTHTKPSDPSAEEVAPLSKQDMRHIFVGDDTGLLKKLKMTLSTTQNVITEPAKRR